MGSKSSSSGRIRDHPRRCRRARPRHRAEARGRAIAPRLRKEPREQRVERVRRKAQRHRSLRRLRAEQPVLDRGAERRAGWWRSRDPGPRRRRTAAKGCDPAPARSRPGRRRAARRRREPEGTPRPARIGSPRARQLAPHDAARVALDLRHVEDPEGAQEAPLPRAVLLSFTRLLVSILNGYPPEQHDRRAVLALADVPAEGAGLLEGEPARQAVALGQGRGPRGQDVDLLVEPAGGGVDRPARPTGAARPRLDPRGHALLELRHDPGGDLLVNPRALARSSGAAPIPPDAGLADAGEPSPIGAPIRLRAKRIAPLLTEAQICDNRVGEYPRSSVLFLGGLLRSCGRSRSTSSRPRPGTSAARTPRPAWRSSRPRSPRTGFSSRRS